MIEGIGIEIKPVKKRVLLSREGPIEDETQGGILLPQTSVKPPMTARILEKGRDVSEDIEVDRLALVPRWSGTEVQIGSEWYLLLSEEDILAYVD